MRAWSPAADLHAGQDGFVLLGVLVLSSLLLTLGIFATTTARTEVLIAHNDLLHRQAMAAAEAGITHAFVLVRQDFADGFTDELSSDGTGGGLTALGDLTTRDGQAVRFHAFGTVAGDGYYVRVLDNYDETPDDPTRDADFRLRLVSRGEAANAVSVIEAVVKGNSLFPPYGLFGDRGVTIAGGSSIDSYDAGAGPYPNGPGNHGHVGSNGDIDVSGAQTLVNGNAVAGGVVDQGSGTISGDRLEGVDPVAVPPVPSCGPPYSSGSGIIGGYYSPSTGQLRSQDGGPPQDIVLSAGTYCFSSITLNAGRTLSVVGQVTISLTDATDLSGGALVNPGSPRDLLILSSYTGGGDGIKLAGGGTARAGIYAPGAEVKLTGNGDFYGGIVGRLIDVPGGADVHYDEDLVNVPGLGIELVNWRELRSP